MANTLKFGNGQWAVKDGYALAYNDENGNFKPLPFDFTRSTSATRVNKQGLIETVGGNEPRIDFLNDSNGALLLEPQRSNLALYSNDLSNAAWVKTLSTITSNAAISPDGTLNANKIVETTDNNLHRAGQGSISVTSGQIYTFSFYAKAGERNELELQRINTSGTVFNGISVTNADLTLGTLSVGSNVTSSSITSVGNGWHRITISLTAIATGSGGLNIGMEKDGNVTYQGDGTSGVYIWGFQVEQGSYATSYIPTSGSAVTKTVDVCSQTVPSGIIGQTEGVVYIDFLSVNNFEGSSGILFEIKEDNNNRINIYFSSGTPRLFGIEDSSGVFNQALSLTTGSVCKLAIKYNSTSTKVFINGSLSHTLNGINNIAFNDYSFSPNNNIDYNEIKLYNTALTDAELATLTTI